MNRRRTLAAAAVVALAAIAKFASAPGQSFLLSVFVDDLIADAGTSRTAFSLMYGGATVFSATVVLRLGPIVDRIGIARVWVVVAVGLAAGCLVMGFATGPIAVFAALCLMRAFGQGSFPLLGTVLVASRFEAARGKAIGLSAQGVTAASAVLPIVAVALIESFGWRSTLQVFAACLVCLVLPLGAAVSKVEGRRRQREQGEQMSLREALGLPRARSLLFMVAIPPLVVTGVVVHAVSLVGEHGLSTAEAAGAIGLMAIATVAGSLLGGAIVDRSGVRPLLVGMALGLVVSLAVLSVSAGVAMYAGFLVLGGAAGFHLTAGGTVWAKTYGVANLGRLQGLGAFAQIAGAAAGPLPLALAYALTGTYIPGLAMMALLSLSGVIVAARWRPAPKVSSP